MTTGDRRSGGPEPVDPLALAEAVAAGRLGLAAAEAALWEARPDDQARAATDVDELRDLVASIRGIRRHAEASRRAEVDVFDPDAAGVPLGSGRRAEDDRGTAPLRVHGGDVRLRPGARPRPRWAPVGALAAAAVLVVAVALIAPGLLAPSIATTPSPSARQTGVANASPSTSPAASRSPSGTPNASPSQSPGPSPTPGATGVKGVPAITSAALLGAPGIAYWTLTAVGKVTVTEWRPGGGAPRFRLSMSTLHDPDLPNGQTTDRRVVVSPDGSRVAFAETAGTTARTRVFATDGSLLWTDPQPTFTPDLAWSPDGSRLVVGSQPATWKVLTFPATGAPGVVTRDFSATDPNAAYRVLGFSSSGAVLYGWNTQGEAEWWSTPFQWTIGAARTVAITSFAGANDPLAVSNGTTATTNVAPSDRSTTEVTGVDEQGLRGLDTGGASGQLNGWEVRDTTTTAAKLKGLTMDMALAWGPAGSIVVADVTATDHPATITTVDPSAPGTPLTPTFSMVAGGYWRLFEGSRAGFGLLGLAAHRADAAWLGADELVAIDLASAGSAVLVPTDPGMTGLHPAGWLSAP